MPPRADADTTARGAEERTSDLAAACGLRRGRGRMARAVGVTEDSTTFLFLRVRSLCRQAVLNAYLAFTQAKEVAVNSHRRFIHWSMSSHAHAQLNRPQPKVTFPLFPLCTCLESDTFSSPLDYHYCTTRYRTKRKRHGPPTDHGLAATNRRPLSPPQRPRLHPRRSGDFCRPQPPAAHLQPEPNTGWSSTTKPTISPTTCVLGSCIGHLVHGNTRLQAPI